MGYRSTIGIRIELPKGVKSSDVLSKLGEFTNNEYTNFFDNIKTTNITEDVECILLLAEYVKWYSGYKAVKGVEEFLNWFEKEIDHNETLLDTNEFYVEENLNFNFYGAYHFVRIGEDLNDIEEHQYGNLWDWINIIREIDFNF
jgi:hypothetical protein